MKAGEWLEVLLAPLAEEQAIGGIDLAHALRQEAVMVRGLGSTEAIDWMLAEMRRDGLDSVTNWGTGSPRRGHSASPAADGCRGIRCGRW